jgi:hypothetical protein
MSRTSIQIENINFIYPIFEEYKYLLKVQSFNEDEIFQIIEDDVDFYLNDADEDTFYIIKPDDSLKNIELKIKLHIDGKGKDCDSCAELILHSLCGSIEKYMKIFCSEESGKYGLDKFYKIPPNPKYKYAIEIENKIKDSLYCSLLYLNWNKYNKN